MPPAQAGPGYFPPEQHAQAKAIACELPAKLGLPLSRLSTQALVAVLEEGIGLAIGRSTVHRWLREDALRPWCHRTWIFPRDPRFVERMVPVLDLYERRFEGGCPGLDYVLSADEKTSIQVLRRRHPAMPPSPGHIRRGEFEYQRCDVWAYLAELDVHQRIYETDH